MNFIGRRIVKAYQRKTQSRKAEFLLSLEYVSLRLNPLVPSGLQEKFRNHESQKYIKTVEELHPWMTESHIEQLEELKAIGEDHLCSSIDRFEEICHDVVTGEDCGVWSLKEINEWDESLSKQIARYQETIKNVCFVIDLEIREIRNTPETSGMEWGL
jgi:hypothetical protein